MTGCTPAERTVTGPVTLDHATSRAEARGFAVRERHDSFAILRREGTQLTLKGEKFPLELALAQSGEDVFLQLRYAGFVLGDTGDLDRLADDLAEGLATADA